MPGIDRTINRYLRDLDAGIANVDLKEVERLSDYVYDAWRQERSIFVFGNGGSGATASHFAEDLGKNALRVTDLADDTKVRPIVMSLTDNTSWITAIANDLDYEQVFVQQLVHFARAGDLVLAISGSGNSPNVITAVNWAKRRRMMTFGLTGFDGGRLRQIQQDGLHIPVKDMGMVESLHLTVLHWVVDDLHARINHIGRYATARTAGS